METCDVQGAYPNTLKAHPNSMVCTDETDMLAALFNQTARRLQPIRLQSRECKNAAEDCDDCLARANCAVNGETIDAYRWRCHRCSV